MCLPSAPGLNETLLASATSLFREAALLALCNIDQTGLDPDLCCGKRDCPLWAETGRELAMRECPLQ